jgi:cytochrome c oxidase cbb3-type subunit 3
MIRFLQKQRANVLFCLLLLSGLILFLAGAISSPTLRTTYHRVRNKNTVDRKEGEILFVANCGPCHGLGASGGRGPALIGRQLSHGSSEAELLTVIREGIAGSTMPSFTGTPDEETNIIAYIRGLSGPTASSQVYAKGDATRGAAIYARYQCDSCHLIGNTGSAFGPELTRVGASRSYAYLKQSLVDPSAEITPGSEGVTVTTMDGKRVVGIRINEDTFTVQIRDQSQRFMSFDKNEVKSVNREAKSLMPSYDKLPSEELDDLLAYLSTLRAEVQAGSPLSSRGMR